MNKKGLLLASETLKIVLGVISIGLLLYLLSALYFSNVEGKEFEQAQATMDKISETIEGLVSEGMNFNITDITPVGWILFSFVQGEVKPNSCVGEKCLCLCDKVIDVFDRQIKECDNDGICLKEKELAKFLEIELKKGKEGFTSISISKIGGFIEVQEI